MNVEVKVTDVSFKSSDWAATDVDMYFNNCQMKSLFIAYLTIGTNARSGVHLTVSNCDIGYIDIQSAKATIQNCVSSLESDSGLVPIGAINSTVVLKSVHIENFTGANFLQISKSTCYLTNVTFTNCGNQHPYSIVTAKNESFIGIENCTFLSNYNALIDIKYYSSGFINNSSFLHSKQTQKSTCTISIWQGSLLLVKYSSFSNNTVLSGAAEVCVGHESVGVLENSSFNNNQGGAIYIYNSVASISSCWFRKNSAQYGASLHIFCDRYIQNQSSKTMEKVLETLPQSFFFLVTKTLQFRQHSIQKDLLPRVQLHNCTFVENTAEYGGAIYAENIFGTLFIQACLFSTNQGKILCGTIAFVAHVSRQSTLVITNSSFSKNKASGDKGMGGAICVDSKFGHRQWGAFLLSNCSFNENQALGGGAIVANTYCHLRDSVFNRNSAGMGGALQLESGVITNCSFDSNIAIKGGGGAISLLLSSTSIVSYSNFTNNTAAGGGAIHNLGNVSFSCLFCFFYNNRATKDIR